MEGKPTGLAYKQYNVIVMDSGDDTTDYALYHRVIEKFSSFEMNLTICSLATNPEAESRVERIARRLHRTTWDGQRYIGIIAKELVPFPEKIILIMPPGKRRKQILLKLMREISPCPPIIVAGTPAESLIDTIELLAHAQIHETEIWVGASWRYAVGVRAVLSQLSKLVPISHILASANSGAYTSPALYSYGTVWRYADLICCIARQAGESEIPEDLCCYHSALYRDSIVMSFAFQGGLIGSLTSTSNHIDSMLLPFLNDNLLSITGFERWITLTDSLRKSEFSGAIINELRYSDDDDDYLSRFNLLIKDFISNSGKKNYNVSSTSLRSCLPSMWMMDAIRDAIGKKNHTVKRDEIDGEPLDAILKRIDLESLTSTKKLRKMGIAYAKAGQFDLAIDAFAKRIELD